MNSDLNGNAKELIEAYSEKFPEVLGFRIAEKKFHSFVVSKLQGMLSENETDLCASVIVDGLSIVEKANREASLFVADINDDLWKGRFSDQTRESIVAFLEEEETARKGLEHVAETLIGAYPEDVKEIQAIATSFDKKASELYKSYFDRLRVYKAVTSAMKVTVGYCLFSSSWLSDKQTDCGDTFSWYLPSLEKMNKKAFHLFGKIFGKDGRVSADPELADDLRGGLDAIQRELAHMSKVLIGAFPDHEEATGIAACFRETVGESSQNKILTALNEGVREASILGVFMRIGDEVPALACSSRPEVGVKGGSEAGRLNPGAGSGN